MAGLGWLGTGDRANGGWWADQSWWRCWGSGVARQRCQDVLGHRAFVMPIAAQIQLGRTGVGGAAPWAGRYRHRAPRPAPGGSRCKACSQASSSAGQLPPLGGDVGVGAAVPGEQALRGGHQARPAAGSCGPGFPHGPAGRWPAGAQSGALGWWAWTIASRRCPAGAAGPGFARRAIGRAGARRCLRGRTGRGCGWASCFMRRPRRGR